MPFHNQGRHNARTAYDQSVSSFDSYWTNTTPFGGSNNSQFSRHSQRPVDTIDGSVPSLHNVPTQPRTLNEMSAWLNQGSTYRAGAPQRLPTSANHNDVVHQLNTRGYYSPPASTRSSHAPSTASFHTAPSNPPPAYPGSSIFQPGPHHASTSTTGVAAASSTKAKAPGVAASISPTVAAITVGANAILGGRTTQKKIDAAHEMQASSQRHQELMAKNRQDYADTKQSEYKSELEKSGLPTYLAHGGMSSMTSAFSYLPKTTQVITGQNTYTSKLPGNPQSSAFTGSAEQAAMGWGNVM